MFEHDLRLENNKIFNTLAGISFLREEEKSCEFERKLAQIENDACKVEPVYNTFNMCYVYLIFSCECNLACTYCFEHCADIISTRNLDTEILIKQYIAVMEELANLYEKLCVVLYGGEPLLYGNYKAIQKILEFCKKKKMDVRIVTNGTFREEYMELLSENEFVKDITITVDGNKEIHDCRRVKKNGKGTYEEIFDNIKKILQRTNIRLRIRVNVDSENMWAQERLLEELIELDNTNLSVCYYRTTNNTDSYENKKILSLSKFAQLMDRIYEDYHDKIQIECGVNAYNQIKELLECEFLVYPRVSYCERGYIYLLNYDGNIYTCGEAVGNEQFKLCTINGFVQDSERYKQKAPHSVMEREELADCLKCEVNTICGGGCELARKKKKRFCEKKEIIKTINEMYNRRIDWNINKRQGRSEK